MAAELGSQPPILLHLSSLQTLEFLSVLTRTPLKSLSFSVPFTYCTFQSHTYVLQSTGQVNVYDTATQLLLETISSSGLSQVADLLVVPSSVYCLQTEEYMCFGSR